MATLPGSSNVKRNEKLLESKRPVIPYGSGSQTSFRDQLKGLDGLGLRLLLLENPLECDPKVLLSHSSTMSTIASSNIVKRGGNHLESQLTIIPYGWDEVKCREDIVGAVCKEVPQETRWDDSYVQGRTRMCKTIDEKIGGMELSKCYEVRVLGLYGVGGIGKSTTCMTLCNHYFEEFHGRVCHVQFGALDELHILQEILKRLTDTKHEQIEEFNLDKCKDGLRDIKKQTTFLALDNLCDSYEIVEQAKLILRVGFGKRSIIIVTARSFEELQNLNIEESECMEMLGLMVDDAISLFVQAAACEKSIDEALIRRCIDQCCLSKGNGVLSHYHPLALKVLGNQFGSDPSQWFMNLQEIDVFNQYQEKYDMHPIFPILRTSFDKLQEEDQKKFDMHPIFSILRTSFDKLQEEDQLLFMDCVLSPINCSYILSNEDGLYEWLSMIHGKQIKSQLNHLKQKSMIEGLEDDTTRIYTHDLWRKFCVMETKVGELKSRRWIYEELSGSSVPHIEESNVYCGVLKRAQRMSLIGTYARPCNMHLNFSRCSLLVVLHLIHVHLDNNILDLNGMYNLKSLIVQISSNWEVRGLGSLKQLCLLEWHGEMPSSMVFN